jgi:glycosyltransferase involved in cell wall biosynthesis
MRLPKESVFWSPPYAKPEDIPRPRDPAGTLWDVLFVGTVDPRINPDRCAFLAAVKSRVPELHTTSGAYRDLYPQAKVVLNHTAANDLNFRVFEALGCGACLVTPLVRHGFDDIFRNGRDLFTFDQNDIDGLARLLHTLLAAPARRAEVAARGHEIVKAGHYMRHRAEAFAAKVEKCFASGAARAAVDERLCRAGHIRERWLRLMYLHHAETVGWPTLETAYLRAAQGRTY